MSRWPVPPDGTAPDGTAPDDTGCTVLHLGVDDLHLAVELLRRPELRGRPVLVGAGRRGVVLSASREARRRGVRAGTSLGRARRLCPDAVLLPPHPQDCARAWAGVLEVLRSVTDRVEPLGQGQALLDVAAAVRRLGPPARIGALLRDRVADEQGLTCSVGVATTRSVAALACAAAGPDGLLVVPAASTVGFLHALPVSALQGVGERTGEALLRLGLRTVADVAHTPVQTLVRALGGATGRRLHDLAWGRDPRPVLPARAGRSAGAEQTFPRDVDDPRLVHRELLRLTTRTAGRLRAAGLAGRVVVVTVRFADSSTATRSRTLPEATDVTRTLHVAVRALYEGMGLQRVRILAVGVRVEDLVDAAGQHRQLLIGERVRGWREADGAVDLAGARFGPGAVRPATLLGAAPADAGAPLAGAPDAGARDAGARDSRGR